MDKKRFKNYLILILISLIMYKIIDDPRLFISEIENLAKFLSPFLLGILFTLLINPMVSFFEKKIRVPRKLSILLSYVIVLVVIYLIFNLIVPSAIDVLNTFMKEIPDSKNNINKLLESNMANRDFLKTILPHVKHGLDQLLTTGIKSLNNLSSNMFTYLFNIASVGLRILMGVILSVYILNDKESMCKNTKKLLISTLKKERAKKVIKFVKTAHDVFYHYLVGTVLESLIVGIISFLFFHFVFGIQNSIFYTFVIFITNMIPYFGPFIGAVLPLLMVFTYSPIKAFWLAVFIGVLQQIDGNVIAPKVIGNKVGLNPIWIITAVIIGGELFGVVGLFLAIPITAIINIYINTYVKKNYNKQKK